VKFVVCDIIIKEFLGIVDFELVNNIHR